MEKALVRDVARLSSRLAHELAELASLEERARAALESLVGLEEQCGALTPESLQREVYAPGISESELARFADDYARLFDMLNVERHEAVQRLRLVQPTAPPAAKAKTPVKRATPKKGKSHARSAVPDEVAESGNEWTRLQSRLHRVCEDARRFQLTFIQQNARKVVPFAAFCLHSSLILPSNSG